MNDVKMRPTRVGFGIGLAEIAEQNKEIVCLGADLTSSVSLDLFKRKFPERFFSFGIAEQNIAAIAAGFALNGMLPVFATYATFATTRCLDQIRISICYNNLPVIIGGAHAGISVGPDGATHQSLEDIATMRVLPNMTILSPCDATQAEIVIKTAVLNCKSPIYIRVGRESVPDFTSYDQVFTIGKGQILKQGIDVTIIATGHLVYESLMAAQILADNNISAQVVNIHTIKPIDQELLISCAKTTNFIVSVEEHQIIGGLGSAISEVLSKYYPCRMEFIGMKDQFGESGTPDELLKKYNLDRTAIAERIIKTIK